MRCSIFSSFFSKTSLASPSAAWALAQPMIDIAVAASNAFRLKRRSPWSFDAGKHGYRCNDITTPKSRGDQRLRDAGATNTVAKYFWNQKWTGRLESLHFRITTKLKSETNARTVLAPNSHR